MEFPPTPAVYFPTVATCVRPARCVRHARGERFADALWAYRPVERDTYAQTPASVFLSGVAFPVAS